MKTQQPQLAQLEAAADSLRNNLVTMQDKMAVARMRAPTLKVSISMSLQYSWSVHQSRTIRRSCQDVHP